MSPREFDDQAAIVGRQLASLPPQERIAAGCRGSGNPVALSWLAEALSLDESSRVVELGAGLGGPAEWMTEHYHCQMIILEPALGSARAAHETFEAPVVQGRADAVPFASGAFDAGLLLGVLSVVDDTSIVLREAGRVARSLGIMDYCATGSSPVHAGGSRFVPIGHLLDEVAAAGWNVLQSTAVTVSPPPSWESAREMIETPEDASERAVIEAIEGGALAPFMLVATR